MNDRASFTVAEIAGRNAISLATAYRAIHTGALQVVRLGSGNKPLIRVTPQQEAEWLNAHAAKK